MREQLLAYYERELRFIRQMAGEFATRYPAVAGRLLIEPDKCEDPHVERLIEAFAMLTSRVRMRIDDGFSEVADALLDTLHPEYLAPMPSTTIVQLALDREWSRDGFALPVERGTLLHTPPVKGVRCRFRTSYSVELWPVDVTALEVVALGEGELGAPREARAAIRIGLRTFGGRPFSKVGLDALTFFLDGDAARVHALYEALFRAPLGVYVRDAGGRHATLLPPTAIEPVGFGRDEHLLPLRAGATRGYQLLKEYFWFPAKFLFARLSGLSEVAASSEGSELELLVFLPELPSGLQGKLGADAMKLGCTPAVNLFSHQAEPIQLTHIDVDYPVVPDAHARDFYEVYSVDAVTSTSSRSGETRDFRPFYGLGHGGTPEEAAYWRAIREPRSDSDLTTVTVSLVDHRSKPVAVEEGAVLHVRTTASNGDLPAQLALGGAGGALRIEGKPGVSSVKVLRKPTDVIRPAQGDDNRWKLISHLGLNFLSLVEADGTTGTDAGASPALTAFRELLELHDVTGTAATRQRVGGLVGISCRPVVRRIRAGDGSLHARGIEVRLRFDEERYVGTGVFLFASVLERFLGLYVSINAFVQVVAEVARREGALKEWPPRAGERALV